MLHSNLRRHCQAVVDGLSLPRPFSAEALCRQLSEERGRPLHVLPLPAAASAAGACGLWLATGTSDWIFVEQCTSPAHQEHIVLHEIGHMLFDHHNLVLDDEQDLSHLFTDLGPNLLRRFLARANYSTRQEQEAEMVASLIRTAAERYPAEQPREVMDKLEAALGFGARHAR
ncbi:hypothetical protein FHS39_002164 [Streptomyces olivoverticillatus]|uniref:Regulator component n=1 Tax=Streptomyces olivoverticillatus TaxID=66427 RepID=A0A7W7PL71_9ACTN|nr:hypothetical protein [Streptomyces olivoverticillatus]MBB4893133.1 hypothetical protein [Streptomyces olivoverticillatus]